MKTLIIAFALVILLPLKSFSEPGRGHEGWGGGIVALSGFVSLPLNALSGPTDKELNSFTLGSLNALIALRTCTQAQKTQIESALKKEGENFDAFLTKFTLLSFEALSQFNKGQQPEILKNISLEELQTLDARAVSALLIDEVLMRETDLSNTHEVAEEIID